MNLPMKTPNYIEWLLLGLDVVADVATRGLHTAVKSCSTIARGWVHIVEHAEFGAILLSLDLKCYPISKMVVVTHRLEMGDFVEACITDQVADVTQINDCDVGEFIRTKPGFDRAPVGVSGGVTTIWGKDFNLGSRTIRICESNENRIDLISKLESNNTYKIALVIDESEGCVWQLLESGISEVYLNFPSHDIKQQLVLCLHAFFSAKRRAAEGKDVLFVIDNLSKVFKIYNKNAFQGRLPMGEIHEKAVADLKHLFLSARQLEGGGSLSVVMLASNTKTLHDTTVFNEFTDIGTVF